MVSSDLFILFIKASKLLGLVYRTVVSSNPGAFSTLYKSLVRQFLEYAAPVWNPYLVNPFTPKSDTYGFYSV